MMKNLEQQVSDIIDKIFDEKPICTEDSAEYFIQSILDKMVMKTFNKFPDKIFYFVNDKLYFEMEADVQKRKNGILWVSYGHFCGILINKFQLKYDESKTLINTMIKQHLKFEVGRLEEQWSATKALLEKY